MTLGRAERQTRTGAPAGSIRVDGKFLRLGSDVFRVRGATYGSFGLREDGEPFPAAERVRSDFAAMAAAGLNTVRTYALPPDDVIDAAEEAGLRLIVGLHYHDWRSEPDPGRRGRRRVLAAGLRAVDAALARCSGRAPVLALSVGNEVPADLVRYHGARSVESILSRMVAETQAGDPALLATYTNYPTTEYLHVEGQDLVTFNVFLERPDQLRAYLRHLQIVSGDVPLVVTELGLAGDVHGAEEQADSLAWQLQLVEETGCAGATVFSWTDEWTVGGEPVSGWGFGLTDEARRPKPALAVVREWARTDVSALRARWPKVSVVVCARNEEALIGRCLRSLEQCAYPELEVIVCDDGSTDRTLEIASRFPFRTLALEHGGLSGARNAGIEASTGEIVAFLDADAEAHPEWPFHLALSLEDDVAATGGPNPAPARGPLCGRAIAASPGGPIHVLVGDDRAEHVPGCNMAFRRDALDEIGGFDPAYTAAGDDVDVCWKLLERGHEIGFAPAAQVRHHRPESLRRYLRQQRSYGRAERMLAGRWRHHFNRLGQARWRGSIYGGPRVLPGLLRPVVYHGYMGLAPFQTVVRHRAEPALARLSPLLPLAIPLAALAGLAPLSLWFLLAPALALTALAGFGVAVAASVRPARGERRPLAFRILVGALHVAQPFVRTWGRLRGKPLAPIDLPASSWNGDRVAWLESLRRELAGRGCRTSAGGAHAPWDLEVAVGPLLRSRLTVAVAWHWSPRPSARLRPSARSLAPLVAAAALIPVVPLASLGIAGALAIAATVEAGLLTRAVRRAIGATTAGAG